MSSDRRREPRYVVDWPAEATVGDRKVAGRLINASASGALLALPEQALEPDTTLTLDLHPEISRHLGVEARVRWRARMGTVWGYGLELAEGVLQNETQDRTPILAPRIG